MAEKPTEDQIVENALAPKRASGDQGSMEQHPIADQIAAAEFKAAKAAARRGLGIRHVKLIPPGGTGGGAAPSLSSRGSCRQVSPPVAWGPHRRPRRWVSKQGDPP
jgi:hypothetical protein